MKASGGFTVPELLISSGILAVVVFGGMTVSSSALRSTQASVLAGEADARTFRAIDRLLKELRSASQTSLLAVPPGGQTAVPVTDGVAYDNLTFQQALTLSGGKPLLLPAMQVLLQPDPRGGFELVLTDGTTSRVLCSQVQSLSLIRQAGRITVGLTAVTRSGGATVVSTVERSVILRVL